MIWNFSFTDIIVEDGDGYFRFGLYKWDWLLVLLKFLYIFFNCKMNPTFSVRYG